MTKSLLSEALRPVQLRHGDDKDWGDSETPRPLRPTGATRESITIPENRSYLIRRDDYPHPLCTWNYHPEWEIHFIPDARGFIYIGDHIGAFEHGHISLCGSNLPHNWVSPGLVQPARDYVLQFDAARLLQASQAVSELRSLRPLSSLAERGIALEGQAAKEAGDLMIQLLDAPPAQGLGLFAKILTIFAESSERRLLASPGFASGYAPLARGRHAKIDRAMQHLQATPSISMQEAADLIGANVSTFSRNFKILTRMTFSDYQRIVRISRACSLLSDTTDAITNICFESGYSNLSNFNRAFLKETGMTPREYRKVANIRTISKL